MTTTGSLKDRVMARGIVRMRQLHRRTLEERSVATFRKRRVPSSPAPRLVPAAQKYAGVGWLPSSLLVPEELPKEADLPIRYAFPYYQIGKWGWALHGRYPLDPDLLWTEDSDWNGLFPEGAAEWDDPAEDGQFTQLRLQGPNPFMLAAAEPDPAEGDDPAARFFDLDLEPMFAGVFPAVLARFALVEGRLQPSRIEIDGRIVRPGEPTWEDAKRVVNALDARVSAFVRHLLFSHLIVGEAYALAAYTLPVHHPLREFWDFFSYGVLRVNDIAYQSLLTPNSYFLRADFVTPDDARGLIDNAEDTFDFREWLPPVDLVARGLAEEGPPGPDGEKTYISVIPDHPYVEDALTVWPAIEHTVRRYLADLDYDDELLAADRDLAAWHATLCRILPDSDTVPTLDSIEDLVDLMAAIIYNNAIHEVCGNLSPILDSRDPVDKMGVSMTSLRALADPEKPIPAPRARDVFLMDQAAYVSSYNVAGNNLMTLNAARYIDDPKLRIAVEDLQATLVDIDHEIAGRNRRRAIPFAMMRPRKWEASISF